MKKEQTEFLSENVQFLVVKLSIYLNRRVFVMTVVCEAAYASLKTLFPFVKW